jgi:hypothetical protein
MTPSIPRILLLALALVPCACAPSDGPPQPRSVVIETKPLPIDRIYHSMTGPFHRLPVEVEGMDWITSVHTEVIDQADGQDLGGEFFCHSQLSAPGGVRLAVNATGGERIELPEGFGLPVSAFLQGAKEGDGGLDFFGMVLNNNEPDIDKQVRIRANIDYLSDEDVTPERAIKPLYYRDLTIWVDDICEYLPPEDGAQVNEDVSTHCVLVGDKNVHWMVPPGKQVTRRRIKNIVPVDSTAHLIQAHLHNHGSYVRLTDVTTGEQLWQSDAVYEPDRPQIERITAYSSTEGILLKADHEYELEALYDNNTGADVDAMAVMYVYFTPVNGQSLTLKTTGKRKNRKGA